MVVVSHQVGHQRIDDGAVERYSQRHSSYCYSRYAEPLQADEHAASLRA